MNRISVISTLFFCFLFSMVSVANVLCQDSSLSDTQASSEVSSTFLLKNASENYDFRIEISGCEEEICEGPATLMLTKKRADKPFQTIEMENMFLELGEDQKPTANLIELYGMNNSGLVVNDFNFDGSEDLAIRNGNFGAYGGPSYDILLFSTTSDLFVKSTELTELASDNLGLFDVDKEAKLLETFTKSGCCWHQTTRYRMNGNTPEKVWVMTEDASGGAAEGKVLITTEELIDGKWVKTEKKVDMEAN